LQNAKAQEGTTAVVLPLYMLINDLSAGVLFASWKSWRNGIFQNSMLDNGMKIGIYRNKYRIMSFVGDI
jgi:hypothetical protein